MSRETHVCGVTSSLLSQPWRWRRSGGDDLGLDLVDQLQDSGAKFTVHILAAVAQRERKLTSDRTKAALAAAKARAAALGVGRKADGSVWKTGARLGNPNGAAALKRAGKGTGAALQAVRENAAGRAADYAETIADVRAGGANSLPTIAAELNARGIVTARGGKWHPSTVRNLLARLEPSPS